MTEEQDIINKEQQEAEEKLENQDENEDSDLSDMPGESDLSDAAEITEESDISEEIQEDTNNKSESSDSSEESHEFEETDNSEPSEETEESGQSDMSDKSEVSDSGVSLESVIEAVLFASDESLTPARLANIIELNTKQVRDIVNNLNDKYEANKNAFRIEQIAGGYQMLTLSKFNHWLKKLLRERSETKLSPAAMETLAIIAYKQPVIRADIEAIRGVAVGEVIRSLSIKGLVKIVGRAEILGRPMLYGTTKKFLEVFGLNTLKDLPKIEELKKPPA